MIGLDTNVLVRYLMQDDAAQAAKASRLIERCSAEEPGFIAMVVLVELVWVLESSYGIERARIAAALELLLRTRELRVEQAETAWHAVRMYRDSRLTSIGGGTDEMMLSIICKGMGILPGQKKNH